MPTPTNFTLDISRSAMGRWYIASPELKGLLVSESSLAGALAETYPVIAALWAAMQEAKAAGEQAPRAVEQMAAYAPLFAE